jgi:putative DNA primase/helicase
MAKTNDPSSWSSFEAAARNKLGSGLGCVITDDFVVIDLDHVFDPETKTIEPWAKEIVDQCRSYTEISPSGTGLHIWSKASCQSDATVWGGWRCMATPALAT